MTYTKPSVKVLGNASELIENPTGKGPNSKDGTSESTGPAYDLDE